jgi:hypothetical protein
VCVEFKTFEKHMPISIIHAFISDIINISSSWLRR